MQLLHHFFTGCLLLAFFIRKIGLHQTGQKWILPELLSKAVR